MLWVSLVSVCVLTLVSQLECHRKRLSRSYLCKQRSSQLNGVKPMYCMSVSHYVSGTDSPFLPSSGVTAQRCLSENT
jgi:hypothetical protein